MRYETYGVKRKVTASQGFKVQFRHANYLKTWSFCFSFKLLLHSISKKIFISTKETKNKNRYENKMKKNKYDLLTLNIQEGQSVQTNTSTLD